MARKLLTLFIGFDLPADGTGVPLDMVNEKYGIWKLTRTGSITSFTATLSGRMSPNDAWFVISTLTQADLDANGCAAAEVMLFPEARASVTAFSGTGSLSAWLME